MKLTLKRDTDNGICTIGRLYCGDDFLCYTLENTWIDNQFRISCIPKGTYPLAMKEYGRFFKKHKLPIPILLETSPRSEILIHPGNTAKDTLGCILVGDTKVENGVLNSVKTFRKFNNIFAVMTSITIEKG